MDPKRALLVEKISKMMKKLRKRKEGIKVEPNLQNNVVINPELKDDAFWG